MKLGAFSISLSVRDINASKEFYEILDYIQNLSFEDSIGSSRGSDSGTKGGPGKGTTKSKGINYSYLKTLIRQVWEREIGPEEYDFEFDSRRPIRGNIYLASATSAY